MIATEPRTSRLPRAARRTRATGRRRSRSGAGTAGETERATAIAAAAAAMARNGTAIPNCPARMPANAGPIEDAVPVTGMVAPSREDRRSSGAPSERNASPAVQTAPKATPKAARLASRSQNWCASPCPNAESATSAAAPTVSRRAPSRSVTKPIGKATSTIDTLATAKSAPTCTRVRCRSAA